MSEQTRFNERQIELNSINLQFHDKVLTRFAQLQNEIDELKLALRAATIHPEMFTWSEAPHGS